MTIYIALLRGINVGGKNIIKMSNLKQVFENMKLLDVRTYIQSGNVLFKSDEYEGMLLKKIEREIEVNFGFSVKVILRTAAELEHIIFNCPFSKEDVLEVASLSKGESLYVSFLTNVPLKGKIESLRGYRNENEGYLIRDREIYLLFKNSIRNSKMLTNIQKLDVSSTVRNWKTINKLSTLAKEMKT